MNPTDVFAEMVQRSPDGFIMDVQGNVKEFHDGYAVGCGVRVGCVEEAIRIAGTDQYIGYWTAPNGNSFIDVTDIYAGLATAVLAGLSRGELAIYDFAHQTVLELNNQKEDENA